MAGPKGSGMFATLFGAIFLAVLAVSVLHPIKFDEIPPQWTMNIWFAFIGIALLSWGVNRIRTGSSGLQVGQDTINWVIGILAATFGLLALYHK